MFSPPNSFCSRCGEQLQPTANFCPSCATPVRPALTHSFTPVVDITPTRKVGLGLGLGILFVPHIFSWFTLRKGHTAMAKTIAFVWLAIFVVWTMALRSTDVKTNNSASTLSSSYQTTTKSRKDIALEFVRIDFKWAKEGFGTVMIADFTITNPTSYTVKDLEVTCTHYANSGTEIDSNSRTIYETVPAKGKKVVRNFSMGFIHSQAARSSCKITDLVVQ